MKERGILFSAPMVRAILNGSKTQTRRVMTPQPTRQPMAHVKSLPDLDIRHGPGWRWRDCYSSDESKLGFRAFVAHRGPYGRPGDRLWVKETWQNVWDNCPYMCECWAWCYCTGAQDPDATMGTVSTGCKHAGVAYRATETLEREVMGENDEAKPMRWRSARFMPRWASRITLEVTDVRVQRLQELDEHDSLAEGIPEVPRCGCDVCRMTSGMCTADAGEQIRQYAELWDHINGKRTGCAWNDNPWVWAIRFRRLAP